MSDNGRWQFAFWIITVLSGTWLVGLTYGAIDIDKTRAKEDIRIEKEIREFFISNSIDHQDIKCDLAAIKTKLGIDGR